jgi:dipeptidyl aminopeptidase/acylaminoacyl peptidase
MLRDLRGTPLYQEAEALHRAFRQPGTQLISDAAEISTHSTHVVFAGTLVDELTGTPPTRICLTDIVTGDTRVLSFGPHVDRSPKFSPDGRQIAFLSDRRRPGDFQLYLLDPASRAARSAPPVDGWIEYLHWSPDGQRIVLGVAGHGADTAGAHGAVSSKRADPETPSWMPEVERGDEPCRWRRAWVYELGTNDLREVHTPDSNIWEVAWCGNRSLVALVSPGPGEGLWYNARLNVIELATGRSREVYAPRDQLGWLAASPSGTRVAIVEALCSDRCVVAGDLKLIEMSSGTVEHIDTRGVDVTYTEWRSDERLLLAGHRGFETVVGLYDAVAREFTEVWRSDEISTGGRYITLSGLNESGDCVLVGETYVRAPEIAVVRDGRYRPVRSFDLGSSDSAQAVSSVERVKWNAPDGLEIQGWLLQPQGPGPHPVVMCVHGGPLWHWRPTWLGRNGALIIMLVKRGYAVFFPNPRGSSSRGQAFARHVLGDMGGADTFDCLSGLDYLVEQGIADPKRLGVTGGSYGGFMASWLITQESRFAAAVSVAPVTNQVSAHLISNIPHAVALFLADKYTNAAGKYLQRSPIMQAANVRTPTLSICGALDRCTPPAEAVQFHNALLENGVKSALVIYPQEGHGVQKWPAAFDYAARVVGWFEEHLSAGKA